ncbi:SusC/RagA family TonB-linked outer membrane protein [Winogradskyella aquimaris]|uniref:TonB-dependent receptor n=1 Tax=Winogradskyella aquimaris TaxID=864074 RepID=A0ABU5EIN0_9FLAO|nr:TonB-dependent receptor [Winogradskyella aquimaris]MDY2585802.1 TonB-dependent receptor [Winogradskyella aquimaris]
MKIKIFAFFAMFLSIATQGQNVDVSGTVTEASSGQPLPGVNLVIKNTTKGASTDFDGNFTITDVPLNSILVVSYLGFITQEIKIENANPLNIVLQEDAQSLSEVVVIGYGTQKKKEVTGAVSVLDSESIEKLNPVRVEQAIQGQVAGVNITSNSGSPGSGLNIRIRGITTNGDNAPLILVDGNRISDLSVLNPNDIKSINVLKDATAGIYGVQAANGVILITTKSGRKNTGLKFQLDSYSGVQFTSRKMDLMNARDFAIYVNDASSSTEYFVYPRTGTDWQDEVFERAAISNVSLNVTGGSEKSAYSAGISYLNQDGIVGGSKNNFERLTARLNFQYDILENLKLTANGLHTLSEKQNLAEGGIGAVLYNAVNINPTMPVRNDDGSFALANDISQIEIVNPVAQINDTYNTSRVSRWSAVLGLDYTFLKNFTVTSRFQGNHANVRDDIFRPEVYYGGGKSLNTVSSLAALEDDMIINEVVDFGADYTDFTWDNFITYTNTFNDKHDLTVLLGASLYRTKGRFYGDVGRTEMGTNQPGQSIYDEGMVRQPRFTDAQLDNGADWYDSRLASLFTRVQYSYMGKYLFSAVIRRDVSSQFSSQDGNNVGYFPSGSVGWNVSEEDFMSEVNWISNLKLRASYGIIGNDRIPAFAFITRLDGQATIDVGSDDLLFGLAPGRPGNPDLKWEEQETANVGVDFRLFNNKISISADAYRKQTKDLLLTPQASAVTGVGAPATGPSVVNAGTVRNTGLEFALGYSDNFSDDFRFNFNFNFTTIKNEVISLNGRTTPVGGEYGVGLGITDITRMEPGLPLGHYYGYQTNGIYQTQAQIDALNASAPSGTYSTIGDVAPGDLIFVDTNGDGEITADDRTNLGDPIPDATFGINIGFTYKNIDFSANAFASVGQEMVRNYERKDLFANRGTYMLDRWQGTGTSNSTPRAVAGANVNSDFFSDFHVEDASFLRLQNVQIGYTFGEKFNSSVGVDKFRIYLSGNNLVTLTDYLGFDPSANNGNPLGGGIDNGFYPVAASYLLGINLNF